MNLLDLNAESTKTKENFTLFRVKNNISISSNYLG
jgi:hypothetical protein